MNPRSFFILVLGLSLLAPACSGKDKSPPKKAAARTSSGPAYVPPKVSSTPRNVAPRLPYQFPASIGVSHSKGDTSQPYIAMTFDDGPHPTNTPRLLDMLRARNIKATFYVIGENVERYPALTRRIVAEGHELGNHTWTHANLKKLSDQGVRRELDRTKATIIKVTGVQPRTMRPPYGALLQRQREMIFREYGYPTILWAVDPQDWKRPGPSVVTSRILNATRNGSIVLAHDLHAPTIDAMPATFDGLLRKGFRFVTVSQLLAQKAAAARQSGSAAGN